MIGLPFLLLKHKPFKNVNNCSTETLLLIYFKLNSIFEMILKMQDKTGFVSLVKILALNLNLILCGVRHTAI